MAALEELASDRGLAAEDWSDSVEILCRHCSEGVPHRHHLHEAKPWEPERRIGVAAREDDEVRSLLERWSAAQEGVEILDVVLELDAAKRPTRG